MDTARPYAMKIVPKSTLVKSRARQKVGGCLVYMRVCTAVTAVPDPAAVTLFSLRTYSGTAVGQQLPMPIDDASQLYMSVLLSTVA